MLSQRLTPFGAHQDGAASVSGEVVSLSTLLQVPPEGCVTLATGEESALRSSTQLKQALVS